MKKDWIIVIVVFYISCEIMCCLFNAKKCLRMFKSVSILIFDQNSINGRYFQRPRGILDAIIRVTEGLNSIGTLYIARFHKYAPLLRDPKMIPSCSRCPGGAGRRLEKWRRVNSPEVGTVGDFATSVVVEVVSCTIHEDSPLAT